MELEIQYFPQTDTLYNGSAEVGNEGYDIADNLIAHTKEDGEVVGISLEHAIETLASNLREHILNDQQRVTASVLRDEGESS